MRKTLLAAGALSALIALSACGGGYGYYRGAEVGPPDVYYDGFYGDYPDGYWGADDAFYYRDHGGAFVRDENHHFQHGAFNGARGYHAHMHAPAGEHH